MAKETPSVRACSAPVLPWFIYLFMNERIKVQMRVVR